MLIKLRDRCLFFEEKSAELEEKNEELELRQRELENDDDSIPPVPNSVKSLKTRGKRKPFDLKFIKLIMQQLGNGTEASRVVENVLPVLQYARPRLNFTKGDMPGESTVKIWRYSMAYVCMAQVGYELTKAARYNKTITMYVCVIVCVSFNAFFLWFTHPLTRTHTQHTYALVT